MWMILTLLTLSVGMIIERVLNDPTNSLVLCFAQILMAAATVVLYTTSAINMRIAIMSHQTEWTMWVELFLSILLSVGILKIIERMTAKTRGTIQRLSSMRAIKTTKDEAQLFQVRFDGFAGLPARKGVDRVDSPEFTCFGNRWHLRVHPGGNILSDDGKVAVYRNHLSDESIEVQATLTIKATSTNTHTVYRDLTMYNYPSPTPGTISTAMAMKILPSGRHSLGHSLLMCK